MSIAGMNGRNLKPSHMSCVICWTAQHKNMTFMRTSETEVTTQTYGVLHDCRVGGKSGNTRHRTCTSQRKTSSRSRRRQCPGRMAAPMEREEPLPAQICLKCGPVTMQYGFKEGQYICAAGFRLDCLSQRPEAGLA